PTRFEVRVDLPSYDFRQVESGARAVIGGEPPVEGGDVDPLVGDDRVPARLHALSPSLAPETRTFQVILHSEGDHPRLQDGEFVPVWIALPALQDSLAVPREVLRYRNDQAFLFVVDKDSGRVNERRVEVGQRAGAYRAVIDGVEEGERGVSDGRAALYDGQRGRILAAAEASECAAPTSLMTPCRTHPGGKAKRCARRTRWRAFSSCSRSLASCC